MLCYYILKHFPVTESNTEQTKKKPKWDASYLLLAVWDLQGVDQIALEVRQHGLFCREFFIEPHFDPDTCAGLRLISEKKNTDR